MRDIVEKGMDELEAYASGEKGKPADTLKAIDIAAKYGLNEKIDKGLIDELWAAVERTVSEEDLPKVHDAWNLIVGRRLIEAAT